MEPLKTDLDPHSLQTELASITEKELLRREAAYAPVQVEGVKGWDEALSEVRLQKRKSCP